MDRTNLMACRKTIVRWLRVGAGVAVAGLVAVVLGLYFSGTILGQESNMQQADAIVVLGGEKTYRPARAVEVYQQCSPGMVVVAGAGDCLEVQRYLEAKGVPPASIELEPQSHTTKQNAEYSVKLLRERHVKRAIVVTSWFHTRRALRCFRHFAPEIEFAAAGTVADRPKGHWPNKYERGWVLVEYLKLAYYWPRYGIGPW